MASRGILAAPGFDWRSYARCAVAPLLLSTALGCATADSTRYPLQSTFWTDPDLHPFSGKPEEYESPFAWDAADQTLFRPISRAFALDVAGEASNTNAYDEVPDSSWFTNRIGRYSLTPEQAANSACTTPPLPNDLPWIVAGAKPNGANPGFMIKGPDGNRYMVKFDGIIQGPRATAADVIVSRIYHAAGYHVPCNRITTFSRSILQIAPDATAEEDGVDVPLTDKHLDEVLSKAIRGSDGRYRCSVSLFVEGSPIGPWRYQGVRDDDPNDVIPHEDRRELRGMRVLAAWVNHFDSREQNTLATFVAMNGSRGFVRHHVIDFGDCFGSIWEPPMLGKRIGHSNYFDVQHVIEDFLSLGTITRPWDVVQWGPSGDVFGYFNAEAFVPEQWQPGYPNPAFARMSERDAAWMARIIAAFDDDVLRATLAVGKLTPELEHELFRILQARRRKLLFRYLGRLSALAFPEVVDGTRVCMRDLALTSGLVNAEQRAYSALGRVENEGARPLPVHTFAEGPCVQLPSLPSPKTPKYLRLDVSSRSATLRDSDARVHLYHLSSGRFQIVALERRDAAATAEANAARP